MASTERRRQNKSIFFALELRHNDALAHALGTLREMEKCRQGEGERQVCVVVEAEGQMSRSIYLRNVPGEEEDEEERRRDTEYAESGSLRQTPKTLN